jgi:hypothetical protein
MKKELQAQPLYFMACPTRLERVTFGSAGRRSIRAELRALSVNSGNRWQSTPRWDLRQAESGPPVSGLCLPVFGWPPVNRSGGPDSPEVEYRLSPESAVQMRKDVWHYSCPPPHQLVHALDLTGQEGFQLWRQVGDAPIIILGRARIEPDRTGIGINLTQLKRKGLTLHSPAECVGDCYRHLDVLWRRMPQEKGARESAA